MNPVYKNDYLIIFHLESLSKYLVLTWDKNKSGYDVTIVE
jgi:hypothetical protein